MASDKKKPGWVEGRTRESADGLRGRQRGQQGSAADQRRLREAVQQEQAKREEQRHGKR